VLRGTADLRGDARVALTNVDCTRTHTRTRTHAQVDGCSIDFTATDFQDCQHRSHVCNQHKRDLEVMLNGRSMRFCHQVRKI
jgi:hypothetical protein